MKKLKGFVVAGLLLLIASGLHSQTVKILFDATKAEMAGNADWVIDADAFNLGPNGAGAMVIGQGSEANPQAIPTPSQANITSATAQGYWKGALSYWAIDCVNRGYYVETLPYNGLITYGNTNNPQDLSNYDVYIVCEPNIAFTTTEKTDILNYVQHGGSLFMVSDHDQSDRNNDGWDSPHIWNDLMNSNSVQNQAFGMTFDYVNISQTSSNIPNLPNDSLLHGPAGNVQQVQWFNGTTITLDPLMNPSVKGVVYKTGSSFGNANAMCAYARYGDGKVAALADSSPCDDGSGDTGDQLYDGYIADANGNHQKLIMNMTIWLATKNPTTAIDALAADSDVFVVYPNPFTTQLNIQNPLQDHCSLEIYNLMGQVVLRQSIEGLHSSVDVAQLPVGLYGYQISRDHICLQSGTLQRQ